MLKQRAGGVNHMQAGSGVGCLGVLVLISMATPKCIVLP